MFCQRNMWTRPKFQLAATEDIQLAIPNSLDRPERRLRVDVVTDLIFKEAHYQFEIIEPTSNGGQLRNIPVPEGGGEVEEIYRDLSLQMIEITEEASSDSCNQIADVLTTSQNVLLSFIYECET